MDHTGDLYKTLNLEKNATHDDIKKSFRKLVLQWHPDKNKSADASEKFNHIKIAYEILSNKDSKDKYDALNNNQHDNLLKVICNFVKSIINPENINKLINIICDNDMYMMNEIKNVESSAYKHNLSNGPPNNPPNNPPNGKVNLDNPNEYNNLKQKIEQRLKNKIDLEYINNFMHSLLINENKLNTVNLEDVNLSIFFGPDEVIPEKNYKLIQTIERSDYSASNKNVSQQHLDTTNEMDIYGDIKTTLDELYTGSYKEINVVRQIIETRDKINTSSLGENISIVSDKIHNYLVYKTYKYKVPLTGDQITFEKQGDEYYDENNNIKVGNLIIDIKCKKHQYFKRVNENDILVSLPLTLYELFNGFNKTFDYFKNNGQSEDHNINITMAKGFSKIKSNKNIHTQTKFDGQKIIVTLSNLGLLLDEVFLRGKEHLNGMRGNLIIYLVLIKKEKFNEMLKKYFDN